MLVRSLAFALLALSALATPALAQPALGNLTQVSNGSLHYRWSRPGTNFTVELHDKTATWTQDEAILVRDALDKLPDKLLEKSLTKAKVKVFRRDAIPIAKLGRKAKNASATTVVDDGYVSYGDVLFKGLNAMWVYATVTHELGHCAQYAYVGHGNILGKLQVGYVDREDFAETVEFYWLAPDELMKVSPAKFAFMRDRIFEGVVSPPSARDPNKKAIAPVTPSITKLGDAKDDFGSIVTIKGEHFMSPRDGGFNTVRYGTNKAVHLSISRKTMWSWVPSTKPGSAPVTVTTQDGTSNAAAFEIKKPWWKFW